MTKNRDFSMVHFEADLGALGGRPGGTWGYLGAVWACLAGRAGWVGILECFGVAPSDVEHGARCRSHGLRVGPLSGQWQCSRNGCNNSYEPRSTEAPRDPACRGLELPLHDIGLSSLAV